MSVSCRRLLALWGWGESCLSRSGDASMCELLPESGLCRFHCALSVVCPPLLDLKW